MALAAGSGVRQQLAERRQSGQPRDGDELRLDVRHRGRPLPGRPEQRVAGQVDVPR